MNPGEPAHPVAVTWSDDIAAADWILGRLTSRPRVGAVVPTGFAAYARILHRAWTVVDGRRRPVRWSELAACAGVDLDVGTWFEDLAAAVADPAIEAPLTGSLTGAEVSALLQRLERCTSPGRSCRFAYWDGWAWLRGSPAVSALALEPRTPRHAAPVVVADASAAPRVPIPDRPMVLHGGPVGAAAALCRPPISQSPNLWWPGDRAWCVASEVDFSSTYVGGSEDLVDSLLGDPRLEVLRVRVTDHVTD